MDVLREWKSAYSKEKGNSSLQKTGCLAVAVILLTWDGICMVLGIKISS